jgi:hypothetical protein
MLSATIVLLALAATGVQFGSEALPGGGNTYIVQVEPELIDSFRKEGFASDVPPGLRDIRRIEIRVGTAPLPNQGLTALKVPTNGLSDSTKPRLDVPAADPGSKHISGTGEPKIESGQNAPKKLPVDVAANPLAGPREPTVDQTSFQSRERPVPGADGGPSAADRTLANTQAVPGGKRAASPNDSDSEWASIPLLAALGALIVSAAANLYLGWVHVGTRRRYHEVVGQLRETELPIAIER